MAFDNVGLRVRSGGKDFTSGLGRGSVEVLQHPAGEPPAGRPVADRTNASRRGAVRRVAVALVAGLVFAAWSSAAHAFTLKVTGPSNAPQMVFNNQMKVVSVCLPVTNPTGGQSVLYGQRFTDGSTSPLTPAI